MTRRAVSLAASHPDRTGPTDRVQSGDYRNRNRVPALGAVLCRLGIHSFHALQPLRDSDGTFLTCRRACGFVEWTWIR